MMVGYDVGSCLCEQIFIQWDVLSLSHSSKPKKRVNDVKHFYDWLQITHHVPNAKSRVGHGRLCAIYTKLYRCCVFLLDGYTIIHVRKNKETGT